MHTLEDITPVDAPSNVTAELCLDPDPFESPRKWSTLSTIAAKNENWADEDAPSASTESEFFLRLACRADSDFQIKVEEAHYEYIGLGVGMYDYCDQYPNKLIKEARDITFEHFYIAGLHVHQHSGIAMSTTPFQSPWDSGQAGFVYVSKAKAQERAPDDRAPKDWALEIMGGEVETFGQYLNGDVYGYRVEYNGDTVDSCWGFYDRGYCKEQGRSSALREVNRCIH